MNPSDLVRFWSKVKKSDNCWEWTAFKNSKGYGDFSYKGKSVRAHRFSYELFNDDIPKGLILDHLCRNPSCVNHEHLEVVTITENVLRGDIGHNHPNSRKTHCPQGHTYSEKNTVIDNNGSRRCLQCRQIRNSFSNYKQKIKNDLGKVSTENKGVGKN